MWPGINPKTLYAWAQRCILYHFVSIIRLVIKCQNIVSCNHVIKLQCNKENNRFNGEVIQIWHRPMFLLVVLSNIVQNPPSLSRCGHQIRPCTTRPPLDGGNCYSESWTSGAALINKVFIGHFPWWFSLISPLIVLFHQTRSVPWACVCVFVCLCAPRSSCSDPPSQWTAANRLLMEVGLKTAEGTVASYN